MMKTTTMRMPAFVPAFLMFCYFPATLQATLQATVQVTVQAGTAAASRQTVANEILEAAGVQGGLIVHIGCGDGKLTAALHPGDGYLVHGLAATADQLAAARRNVRAVGPYGSVSIDRLPADRLPYIDNLVNLVVAEDLGRLGMDEVMRVLCPGGVAYVKQGSKWTSSVKPRPKEIDEWTHYMHDPTGNAVAHDSVVGPPRRLQWLGSPRWSRHHDNMSSVSAVVSAAGRVFYIFDEASRAAIERPPKWSVIARDAFNGTILWKRAIDTWHVRLWPLKSGPAELPRRLVAVGDTVYVTLGLDAPLTALDAATGKTIRTYEGTASTEEVIVSDGVLLLLVEKNPAERTTLRTMGPSLNAIKRLHQETAWGEAQRSIMAVEAGTGEVLWQKQSRVLPLTLAADSEAVYFHDGEKVVSLDRARGERRWASAPVPRRSTFISEYAPTLVVYRDVVLFAGGADSKRRASGPDSMTALDARTGRTLWSAEHPPSGYRSPEDVLVAGGLVWTAATTSGQLSGVFTGRDPRTGEIQSEFAPDVETYWFHHRCHRGKATDRYLLMSRTGIEFVDYRKEHWMIHHWVRGACLYGVMPANGLIYAPPHPCACYPEAKLYGFNALAPASTTQPDVQHVSDTHRLERGPAYDQAVNRQSPTDPSDDWPTYRGNAARSGATGAPVPASLEQAWQVELGGKLSAVTVAGGRLFVASVDTHTVHALDAGSGKPIWSYTAGGRVDSPPTIWQGRVLFGSADGRVYCLRADDGRLIWRFRAAPVDRRHAVFEQVESVWPVHGSVLVDKGVVRLVAGRSMILDGGMRFLRLDAKTGRKLSETILDERDPETGENLQARVQTLQMPVALPDILSSDGKRVYMKSQVFDLEGNRGELGPHSGNPAEQGAVQGGELAHLFCPTGFLDDSWWHRTYWVYGRSFAGGHAGYYQAGKLAPSGRILVFDDSTVYGFGRKPQYYRWTTPLEHHLFAASREPLSAPSRTPVAGSSASGSMVSVGVSASLDPTKTALTVEAWVKAGGRDGVIVARGGQSQGYALVLRDGKPRFVVRADKLLSSARARTDVLGKWVHLAGVLTADKRVQLYVDGRLAGSAAATGLIGSDPKQPMEVADDAAGAVGEYGSPFGLAGVVDELRVYHRALGADEIMEHYSATEPPAAPDDALVLYYSFDKGDATDGSGHKNHGRPTGVQAVEGRFGKALKFTGAGSKSRTSGVRFLVDHRWTRDLPLLVRAMVLSGETLFIAGPPDLVDEEDAASRFGEPEVQAELARQSAALEGAEGAVLWAVSTADGAVLAEHKLDALPVFDGMAAAGGRLYLTTTEGKVLSMGRRTE